MDTAGLRGSSSKVERLGIEIAHRYLACADVVLYCRETGCARSVDEASFLRSLSCPIVKVRTKWDLAAADAVVGNGEVAVSVVSGQGLSELKEVLRDLLYHGIVEGRDEVPIVTRRRQADLLMAAGAEVGEFAEALARGIPPEVASAHLKAAESALEEILGVVATDDVLDRVFNDFCIGK